MAKPSLAGTLDFLRRLVSPPELEQTSDRALVDAFVRRRDEAAFTAMVRRHGPMVLAVCGRVVRDPATAEDAFQATFLVLARRAGSVRKRDSLGSWLHGVALRVARRAQARQGREARRQRPLGDEDGADRATEPGDPQVRAVVAQELDGLPEPYRAPLVLCYLEGLSVEQAARRLGWTAGTVRGRLWRGRKR
jgi:RNA polymerase sigma factor (sigma-70 family)